MGEVDVVRVEYSGRGGCRYRGFVVFVLGVRGCRGGVGQVGGERCGRRFVDVVLGTTSVRDTFRYTEKN